jgi:Fe-Mn family superoxide dismutase
MKRRDFILKTGIAGAGLSIFPESLLANMRKTGNGSLSGAGFALPELGYEYTALEPYIDAQTMEIHHSRHHAGYVRKLNAALEGHRLAGKDLVDILSSVHETAEDRQVLNNAGGHYNHSLFWKLMTPGGADKPQDKVAAAIKKSFGSNDVFQEKFAKAAATVFGSGWAWLSLDDNGELFISSTRNQENPLMKNLMEKKGRPILALDVWEHAYYLKYQNRRKEYIANFMKLINWDEVEKQYNLC